MKPIDQYMAGKISIEKLMQIYDCDIKREIKKQLPRWLKEQATERARQRLVAQLRREGA